MQQRKAPREIFILAQEVNSKEAFPELYLHMVGNFLYRFLKTRLVFPPFFEITIFVAYFTYNRTS